MTKKYLWETTIGSHMWGMEDEKSDRDICLVYLDDIDDILIGKGSYKGKQWTEKEKRQKYDYVEYELGHVINELKSGNINFLWGVMSPIYSPTSEKAFKYLSWLRNIVAENLSKNYHHSISGLTRNMLNKYFNIDLKKSNDKIISYLYTYTGNTLISSPAFARKSGIIEGRTYKDINPDTWNPKNLSERKRRKKIYQMARTVLFGINLIKHNEVKFTDPRDKYPNLNLQDIIDIYGDLQEVYRNNPQNLPHTPLKKLFDNYLVITRVEMSDKIQFT